MLLPLAAALGFVSVAFGAYTEHGLRAEVSEETYRFLMTAIRYNQIHGVAATAAALAALVYQGPRPALLSGSGWAFVVGTLLFSGSIYVFALSEAFGFGEARAILMLTPVGGVTLMLGWALLIGFGWLARPTLRGVSRGEVERGGVERGEVKRGEVIRGR